MMKRLLAVLLSVLLVSGLFTVTAEADGEHHHKSFVWSMNDTEHWHICVGDGECPDNWIFDKGPHEFNGGEVCTVCGFDRRKEGWYTSAYRVTDININMPAPVAGQLPGAFPVSDSSQANVYAYSYSPIPAIGDKVSAPFDYNTVYTITFDVQSNPGYWFVMEAPTPCTVNGQPATFIYKNGSEAQVRFTYPATAPAPEQAQPETETFTVPAHVAVSGASESTPSPGQAVFHFKIWAGDSSVNITTVSNAVTTNGFGEFINDLVFTVPKSQVDALKNGGLFIQQLDGNANWQFDTRITSFFWDSFTYSFMRWTNLTEPTAPKVKFNYVYVTNIYSPVADTTPAQPQPAPTPENAGPVTPETWTPVAPDTSRLQERLIKIEENDDEAVFTLPIDIGVEQYRTDTPPEAVFHFGLYGMKKDQEYEWENDVVYTHGEGIYSGTISFRVPQGEQLDQLIETGFDVRERSAAVPGWSFAGEVYHVDLYRVDGELLGNIRRLRNVATAESGLKVLYFLNLYGKDGGTPYLMPGNILGIEDLLREIHGKDRILLKDTFRIEKDGKEWEILFTAVKEGTVIGNAEITIRCSEGGKSLGEWIISDVLRVTEDGIYVKLRDIAESYQLLKGKEFPGAEAIGDDLWLGFNDDVIDYLDLTKLDELFRRIRRDAGRVFDELPVECIENGYAFEGGEEEFDGFRMMALNIAQLNHEDWLAMAEDAAVSKEMLMFADDYESAFMDFNEMDMNNAGLMEIIKKLYPRTMTSFSFNITQTGEYEYASEFTCEFADGDDVWVIENSFTTEAVEEKDVDPAFMTAPDEYGSGAEFFRAMILRQAPETEELEEIEAEEPSGYRRRRPGRRE
ncbi:MAG: hypothetical protein IJL78_09310 [Lachnospiraceae bacterium]|nr:hypothetical protein [Lachnospiraceae bacterium]